MPITEKQSAPLPWNTKLRTLAFATRLADIVAVTSSKQGMLIEGHCKLTGQYVKRLLGDDGSVLEWEPHAWRWVHLDEGTSADYRNSMHPGAI